VVAVETIATGPWRWLQASVRGSAHVENGLPCQDAAGAAMIALPGGGGVLVLVAADGAGSARCAERGSRLVCDAMVAAVGRFVAAGGDAARAGPGEAAGWFGEVQAALRAAAGAAGDQPRDWASTLVAAVVVEGRAVFLHVGDGAAVADGGDEAGAGGVTALPVAQASGPAVVNHPVIADGAGAMPPSASGPPEAASTTAAAMPVAGATAGPPAGADSTRSETMPVANPTTDTAANADAAKPMTMPSADTAAHSAEAEATAKPSAASPVPAGGTTPPRAGDAASGTQAAIRSPAVRPGPWGPVFWPEAGEYANCTYFVSDGDAARHLRCAVRTGVTEVALFSDGLQGIALHHATRSAFAPFFRPLFARLRQEPGGEAAGLVAALTELLESPGVRKRTDDDRTLVLASRVARPGVAVGP
jgi:hypothetical protein